MRQRGVFLLEEILLAQWAPGFVFAIAWTAMYEIYHEEGSYFTTLLQEILGAEGMFPYFLALAVLASLPVGMMVDGVRHVVGEIWLGLPRGRKRNAAAAARGWCLACPPPRGEDFEARFLLYRHACATVLTPARAAGNLAVVLLVLGVWVVVKIIQMGGFRVFSATFVIGTPLLGFVLVAGLAARYVTGLGAFRRHAQNWEAALAPDDLPREDSESMARRPETTSPTSSLAGSPPSPLDKAEGQP